jgi:heme-degrading monooxygenase HmoA
MVLRTAPLGKNKAMKFITIIFLAITTASFAQNHDNMTKSNSHSIEIIRYTIPAEQQRQFEQAYHEAGAFLKSSPYCLGYEVIKGTDESQHYIVRIHWTSVDDHLQKFRSSAEFRSFFNLVRPYYNNIEEMKHYAGTATQWWKD